MENISKLDIWILASRPKTLPAAITPVVIGTAFAFRFGEFRIFPALAALIGSLLLQMAANFANDYYDYKRGIDTEERIGPTRVLASGLLTENELKIGLFLTIIFSMLVGLYLIYISGILILIIGLLSILALLTYSGTVIAYGNRGFGDILVFLFFGLIAVNGSYLVQANSFDTEVLIGSIPSGTLITSILVVNNYRDYTTDLKTNKRTLAVIIGRTATLWEYIFLITTPYIIIYYFFNKFDEFLILLPLLTLPLSLKLIFEMKTEKDYLKLNNTLAGTAKLGLFFSLLFAIGLIF